MFCHPKLVSALLPLPWESIYGCRAREPLALCNAKGTFFCRNAVEKQVKGSGPAPDLLERSAAADRFMSSSVAISSEELIFIMPNTRNQSYMVDLSRSLRELHQALVQVARGKYEKEHGPVSGPGELLQLLTRSPAFSWLHALSELMVDIDALLDAETIDDAVARAVSTQISGLLSTDVSDSSDFSNRYAEALQSDPAVVMAHAHVRRAIKGLDNG
jgi:hypothetical protein